MIKTIQHPAVPKAGGDLELSVSYFWEEMAECHPAGDESGGIPIEQGKLQHREERE